MIMTRQEVILCAHAPREPQPQQQSVRTLACTPLLHMNTFATTAAACYLRIADQNPCPTAQKIKSILFPLQVLNACAVMAVLASPARAFLPTLRSTSATRRVQLTASAPASTLRRHPKSGFARPTNRTLRISRRSLVSLCAAADGAKDAAMVAVQAAEEALNRAAEEAGAAAGAAEVQATVAAARAAARNAMESLRGDDRGLSGGGGRDGFKPRQVS